ncbi:MAG: CvpA family protein [Anaerolineales bacterium]|nr:CvpA family protein [Anaerolineales bacterium]
MMSIVVVFWMYVCLFAFIGGMRGWAKELLVTFSAILALAISHVLRRYVPLVAAMSEQDLNLFWARIIILGVLVYFGYQTVVSVQHLASRAARERVQDTLIGVLLGGVNGYFISGSVLYYLNIANYPFPELMSRPTEESLVNTVNNMMLYMPPALLGEPGIYFAIIIAFVFVIVVYI